MASPKRAQAARNVTGRPRDPREIAIAIAKWAGIVVLSLAIIGVGAFGVAYATARVPDPNKDFQTTNSQVFFRDGTGTLGNFAVQNRVPLSFADMPDNAKEAIVAGENETFWTDPGISIPGLVRAVLSAIGPGDTTGGSTITQQYVKVAYLTQDKTITRKLNEIIIALKVNKDLSKEQILEGYLNTVYFGRGAYGLQTASQSFFGIDAKDLNYPQAIALTAMINDPGRLDPLQGDKQRADLLERYQYTINQLVKTDKISEAQKAEWYAELPEFPQIKRDSRLAGPNGYLLTMVKDELRSAGFADAQIEGGGLRIVTTVDSRMQDAAVKAAESMTAAAEKAGGEEPGNLHAALASVDVATGGVLALYGGPNYVASNRNWATTAKATGSTFKTWALVAALRDGKTFSDTLASQGSKGDDSASGATPSGGSISLLDATIRSVNPAFVDLVTRMKDGPNKVVRAAADAGIPTAGFDPQSTIALGYSEVSPLNAASGYATLANGGKQVRPNIVAEVKDAQGQVLYKPVKQFPQTIEPAVAQDVTYALSRAVEEGTGKTVRSLGWPTAGKTGTRYLSAEDETRASWFVGYTKQISTAVMFVAGDAGESDLDAYASGFYGSTYPARTWLAYMKVAQQGLPKIELPGPTKRVSTEKPVYIPAPTSARPTAEPTDTPDPEPSDEPTGRPTTRTPDPEPSATEPEASTPVRGGGRPTSTPTG